MPRSFDLGTVHDPAQLYTLLQEMSRELVALRQNVDQTHKIAKEASQITPGDVAMIRSHLTSGNDLALDITALPGIALNPQKAGVNSYTALPTVSGHQSAPLQELIRVGPKLYCLDSTTNPPSWIAVS